MSKFSISKIILASLLLIVGFYLLFPAVSQAALVPCGLSQDNPDTPGNDESQMCTLCHLVVGVKGIVDYGFRIMVIIGIMMIVVAGITYIISAGNEGMMTTAKGLLKNVLIGFSIILGAWLIINTTMLIIGARSDLGIGINNWYTFTCIK